MWNDWTGWDVSLGAWSSVSQSFSSCVWLRGQPWGNVWGGGSGQARKILKLETRHWWPTTLLLGADVGTVFQLPLPSNGPTRVPSGIWRFLSLLTVGDSLRVCGQGTWVKSVAWRRSGSSGKLRVPLASPHLMWTPFFTGHLALFGGLFDKGLLGLVRVVSFSNLKTGFSVTANEWFYFVHLFQLNFMRFGVLVVFPSFMLSFLRPTGLWYS